MPSPQDRRKAVTQALAMIEEAKRTQSERLARARSRAEDERIKALTAEPWLDCLSTVPAVDMCSGEYSGVVSMPTVAAKELFGTRLAFDLLGCCGDEDQVAAKLREFRKMVVDPQQLFLVCAAALDTIATDVFPTLLDRYEAASGDYDTRVRLAEAARRAWSARLGDLGDDDEAV